MRLKRTASDWLRAKLRLVAGLLAIVLVYVLAALGIAVMIERASAASALGCASPDPRAVPVVSLSRGEIRDLAALAWAEARGEPDPYCAMQAVAAVVVNRVRTNPRYFGATITQVISRPYAFSPFGRDDPQHRRMQSVDERDGLYVSALLAALAALSGADPTRGGTHFHAVGARPAWANDMLVTAKIGSHIFYK